MFPLSVTKDAIVVSVTPVEMKFFFKNRPNDLADRISQYGGCRNLPM